MAKGPGLDIVGILGAQHPFANSDTGLRVVNVYVIEWDEIATRLDIKIGANQYCAAFRSTAPRLHSGQKICVTDDLMTPNKGVIDCINIKAAKEHIIAALEELISDIKNDVQPSQVSAA